MKVSRRELTLFLVTGIVVLFGVTAIFAKPRLARWKEIKAEQAELVRQIEFDRKLIEGRAQWEERLAELSKLLPVFPVDKNVDVHWLSVMDNLARKHGLSIMKRQAGEEKQAGDIYELQIECREWEGDLDALVHFLFDLQSEGVMLDIRQLLIKPKGGDLLRGRFSLSCVYAKSSG